MYPTQIASYGNLVAKSPASNNNLTTSIIGNLTSEDMARIKMMEGNVMALNSSTMLVFHKKTKQKQTWELFQQFYPKLAISIAELAIDQFTKMSPSLAEASKSKEALAQMIMNKLKEWEGGMLERIALRCSDAIKCPACPTCPACAACPTIEMPSSEQLAKDCAANLMVSNQPSWFDYVPMGFFAICLLIFAVLFLGITQKK